MVAVRVRVVGATAMALAGAVLVQQSFEHALCIAAGCSPNLLFALPGVALAAAATLLAYRAWRLRDESSAQATTR
ncbi:hypothetical protein [Halorubellus litoreus]|uniref:PEP-CTERM protein-sorting domain-containing protein n=1 Tax=Halorubellus litoreus TaxID=755308 RepID=A0ABD5V9R2_9EURY